MCWMTVAGEQMIDNVLRVLGGYIDPDMAPLYWGCVFLCAILFIFHRTNCPCVNERKQPETTDRFVLENKLNPPSL